MRFLPALLLLWCEGVLAQSQEPSVYDNDAANNACDSSSTPVPASSIATKVVLKQETSTTATATYENDQSQAVTGSVQLVYLLNQDGTIVDLTTNNVNNRATFDWSASRWGESAEAGEGDIPYPGMPTDIQARVVYTDCQESPVNVKTPTWTGLRNQAVQDLDLAGSTELAMDPEISTPTISSTTMANDWFSEGGEFEAEWKGSTGTKLAWAETDSTIQWLKETVTDGAAGTQTINFGAGTLSLTACELFNAGKLCATKDLASDYVSKIEEGDEAVVAYKTVFSAGKSGNINTLKPCTSGDECTLTGCDKWFIYAKDTSGAIMASSFSSTLEWVRDLTEYTAYLSCNGDAAFSKATISTTADDFPQEALSIGTPEVLVGYPDCNIEGTDEAAGTSFLLDDGRNCTCVMGDAQCTAKNNKSRFRLSDGEAVGLAVSVSVIVLIIIMALIFLCLKKTAQKQESKAAVLNSNTDDHL